MPKNSFCSQLSVVTLSIFTCFAVSACSTSSPESQSTTHSPTSTTGEVSTIKNCGRTIAISKKPERILVVHPSMTEVLVSIGAQDQILGQVWGQANFVDAKYQASVDKVKTISDDIPSQESIVELAPDLIVASGDFWFDGTRLQTLDYFEKQGIPVFINSSGCGSIKDDTLENTWNDIETLGKITGHEVQARDQ